MEKEVLFRTCFFGGYNKDDVKEYVKRLEEELIKAKTENEAKSSQGMNFVREKRTEDMGVVIFDEAMEKEAPVPSDYSREQKKEKIEKDEGQMSGVNLDEMNQKLEEVRKEMVEKEKETEEKEKHYVKEIHELMELNQKLQKETEILKAEKRNYDEDYQAIKSVLLDARVDAEVIISKARQKADMIMKEAQKEIEDKKLEACAILSKCLEENEYSLVISKKRMEDQVKNMEKAREEINALHADVKKLQDHEMWS